MIIDTEAKAIEAFGAGSDMLAVWRKYGPIEIVDLAACEEALSTKATFPKDNSHSYGHSTHCHCCGLDGDLDDGTRLCDESLNTKATPADLLKYEAHDAIVDKLQAIVDRFNFGFGEVTLRDVMWDVQNLFDDEREKAWTPSRYVVQRGLPGMVPVDA